MNQVYLLVEHSVNDGDDVLVISKDEDKLIVYAKDYLQGFGLFEEDEIEERVKDLSQYGLIEIDEELQLEILEKILI